MSGTLGVIKLNGPDRYYLFRIKDCSRVDEALCGGLRIDGALLADMKTSYHIWFSYYSREVLLTQEKVAEHLSVYHKVGDCYLIPEEKLSQERSQLLNLCQSVDDRLYQNSCRVCRFSCYSNDQFQAHLQSSEHQTHLLDSEGQFFPGTDSYSTSSRRSKRAKEEESDYSNSIHLSSRKGKQYQCSRCLKVFSQRSNFQRHRTRKTPCQARPSDPTVIQNTPIEGKRVKSYSDRVKTSKLRECFKCSSCGKSYTRKDNLKRHQRSCDAGKSKNIISEKNVFSPNPSPSDYDTLALTESSEYDLPHSSTISQFEENPGNFAPICTGIPSTASIFAPKLHRVHHSAPDEEGVEGKEQHACNYCHSVFTRKSSLERHLRSRCRLRAHYDDEKEKIFEELLARMEEQDSMIDRLKHQIEEQSQVITNSQPSVPQESHVNSHNTQTNTYHDHSVHTSHHNNSINIQNNTNNEIKLLAFGKEDLSHITDSVCRQILNLGFASVPQIIDRIHFDKDHPQNHNVYVSNLRDKYAMIYTGEDWKVADRTGVINQMYEEKREYLEDKFNEMEKKMNRFASKRFQRFLAQDEDSEMIKNVKEDIKERLYNNRKIPLSTQKQLEP